MHGGHAIFHELFYVEVLDQVSYGADRHTFNDKS